MDSSINVSLESPLSFLGESGLFLNFIPFLMKLRLANRIVSDETPRSAALHLGQCCLPMP